MPKRTSTLAAILLFICTQVVADEIGRPDPRPVPNEDGRPVLNMIGAGFLCAGLAAATGILVGTSFADDSDDHDGFNFDVLAAGIAGAIVMEPFGLALGVHLAGGDDRTYLDTQLPTLGATALVYGAAVLTDESAVLAALIPVQLGVAIATRGGESRRAPAPRSALRLSPWLEPRQQGLVVSGAF